MCYDHEKPPAPTPQRGFPGNPYDTPTTPIYGVDVAGCEKSPSEVVAELFRYHPPTVDSLPKYNAINQAAKNFAEVVLQNCPAGSDRKAAIEYLRLARMTANAAVALNGLSL